MKPLATEFRAPLLWLVLPLAAGLAAGRLGLGDPPWLWVAAGTGLAALSWICAARGRERWWAGLLVGGVGLAGAGWFEHQRAAEPRWLELPPREAVMEVRVDRLFANPFGGDRISGLGRVIGVDEPMGELRSKRIAFSARVEPEVGEIRRGAVLQMAGVLDHLPNLEPVDGFLGYLLGREIHFRLRAGVVSAEVRPPGWWKRMVHGAGQRIETALRAGTEDHERVGGIFVAMMLGRQAELAPDLRDRFRLTGTLHLFAVSGLHIGVIAACLHGLLRLLRVPRLLTVVVGSLLLLVFVDVIGGTPSAVRAWTMVTLFWFSLVARRPGNPVAALAASALAVLVVDPLQLFTASFQLSYAVVSTLLLLGIPLGRRWDERWRRVHPLLEGGSRLRRRWVRAGSWFWLGLGVSLAATLASTPLSIAFFRVFAPGAALANLALMPTAALVIAAGFLSMVCGLLGLTAACVLFNHAALVILYGMAAGLETVRSVPGLFWEADYRWSWWVYPSTVAVLAGVVFGAARSWRRVPLGSALPFAILAAMMLFGVALHRQPRDSAAMKSAYELAMERLQASDPDAAAPLTDAQREELAEIERRFRAKLAERELFLNQKLNEARASGSHDDAEQIARQLASEKERIHEEQEAAKEAVRRRKA